MCQRRKFNKKGFTLIELIVVIAIIGVLSAILVPSYFKYVEQAKLTADKNDVKNMNTVLSAYMMEQGYKDFEAPEIIHIINSAEKGYSFSTRLPNYSIWYNKDTQEIELLENKTVQVEMHSNEGNLLLSTNPLDTSIEEVIPGKILLSKNGKLANALHRLRNLTRAEDFNRIKDELIALGVSREHIELFNPENTLYINAFDGFTSARAVIPDADITDIDNGQNIPYVDNVVFASGIVSIPQLTIRKIGVGLNESTPYPIKLPVTVRTVERDAFTNIVSNSQIKTVDITKVQFEVGSLSVELKTKNRIVKETTFDLVANKKVSVKFTNSEGEVTISGSNQDDIDNYYFYEHDYSNISTFDIIRYQEVKDNGQPLPENSKVTLDLKNVNENIVCIEYVTRSLNYKYNNGDETEDVLLSTNFVKIYSEDGIIAYIQIRYIKDK